MLRADSLVGVPTGAAARAIGKAAAIVVPHAQPAAAVQGDVGAVQQDIGGADRIGPAGRRGRNATLRIACLVVERPGIAIGVVRTAPAAIAGVACGIRRLRDIHRPQPDDQHTRHPCYLPEFSSHFICPYLIPGNTRLIPSNTYTKNNFSLIINQINNKPVDDWVYFDSFCKKNRLPTRRQASIWRLPVYASGLRPGDRGSRDCRAIAPGLHAGSAGLSQPARLRPRPSPGYRPHWRRLAPVDRPVPPRPAHPAGAA